MSPHLQQQYVHRRRDRVHGPSRRAVKTANDDDEYDEQTKLQHFRHHHQPSLTNEDDNDNVQVEGDDNVASYVRHYRHRRSLQTLHAANNGDEYDDDVVVSQPTTIV